MSTISTGCTAARPGHEIGTFWHADQGQLRLRILKAVHPAYPSVHPAYPYNIPSLNLRRDHGRHDAGPLDRKLTVPPAWLDDEYILVAPVVATLLPNDGQLPPKVRVGRQCHGDHVAIWYRKISSLTWVSSSRA